MDLDKIIVLIPELECKIGRKENIIVGVWPTPRHFLFETPALRVSDAPDRQQELFNDLQWTFDPVEFRMESL